MTKNYEFWFVTGSQFLYGPETLEQVEKNSKEIVESLNSSSALPFKLAHKGVMKTAGEISQLIKDANHDENCAGIVTFMHTFSPSKMWINGLSLLQKPYLHLHTQFNREIPNEEIDMNYMNLHQSAHGDREHGFIGSRMRFARKIVVGYWQDEEVQEKIAIWMHAAIGAAVSRQMKVLRFGDNMREVAVTEGDKVETQMKLGWQVNTWPVGELVDTMNNVTDAEIDALVEEYKEKYTFPADGINTIRYQAREEIAMQKMLEREGCMAYTNTFEDLYGMEQLPGLASQNLMSKGYGYGGEGDWKVSAMTAIMKAMGKRSAFMEDYTYDLTKGNELSLGAHMLEVCPSLAGTKPAIHIEPLGIGGKNPPARLIFDGNEGDGIVVSLVDMGGRLRLICQDIECVKPTQTMPNLPVAKVMWKPMPNLLAGAHAWILAGGAHHTVLSFDCNAEMMQDFARIMDIEFVHISKDTKPEELEKELMFMDLYWRMKSNV